MSDELLKPAMDPETWSDPDLARYIAMMRRGADGAEWTVRRIALANAVLPDDSPYKIRQCDVDQLRAFGALTSRADTISASRWFFQFSRKLAALLPPPAETK